MTELIEPPRVRFSVLHSRKPAKKRARVLASRGLRNYRVSVKLQLQPPRCEVLVCPQAQKLDARVQKRCSPAREPCPSWRETTEPRHRILRLFSTRCSREQLSAAASERGAEAGGGVL